MNSQEERNTKCAREIVRILERGDGKAFANYLSEDCVVTIIGDLVFSRTLKTGKDLLAAFSGVGGETLDWKYNIYNTTAQDDRVAVEVETLVRMPSGKLYNCRYHFLWTFRDGKAVDWKEYADTEMVTWGLLDGVKPWPPISDEERIAAFEARRKQFPQD
ncbi:MAG: nuclear transport factor 2 family protein [Dehalobacter sp.]|nr:nuclear transport factor 2 family protein [Dehalobacter sp.]